MWRVLALSLGLQNDALKGSRVKIRHKLEAAGRSGHRFSRETRKHSGHVQSSSLGCLHGPHHGPRIEMPVSHRQTEKQSSRCSSTWSGPVECGRRIRMQTDAKLCICSRKQALR